MGKLLMGSETLVKVLNTKDNEFDQYVNDATVKVGVFEPILLHPDCPVLAFTSGGTQTLKVGDVIIGNTGGAYATVVHIGLTVSTSWAAGDAAGNIFLSDQVGAFQAETLKVTYKSSDIATIAGNSSGGKSVVADAVKTNVPILYHKLTTADRIRIEGTQYLDGEWAIDSVPDVNHVVIATASFTEEIFTSHEIIYVGVRGATNIATTHAATDPDGYYDCKVSSDAIGLIEDENYFVIASITKNSTVRLLKETWPAGFDEGF